MEIERDYFKKENIKTSLYGTLTIAGWHSKMSAYVNSFKLLKNLEHRFCCFAHLQMRKLRLSIRGFPKVRQLASRVQPGFNLRQKDCRTTICTKTASHRRRERNQICVALKGLERKMERNKGDGESKKRKMPRTQGEKKEKNRGIKNESNGEIDIGMFKLGRASGWTGSGNLVIQCDWEWRQVYWFGVELGPGNRSSPGKCALLSFYCYCFCSFQDIGILGPAV